MLPSTPEAHAQFPAPARVAIVTGAARGLGLEIARRLLHDGMAVFMSDVDEAVSDAAAQLGSHAFAIVCDVRDSGQVDSLVQTTVTRLGHLDLFVANAGVGSGGPIAEMSDEAYRQTVGVNLDGAFFSCRAAARTMIPARAGSIVTVGSIFGRDTPAGAGVYGATKAGSSPSRTRWPVSLVRTAFASIASAQGTWPLRCTGPPCDGAARPRVYRSIVSWSKSAPAFHSAGTAPVPMSLP